jgi:hypothetical protein
MEQGQIKTHTAAGAVVSRYTMRVTFKAEYRRANQGTGEVISNWTYRSDKVQEDFRKQKRELTPLDALAWHYKAIRFKCEDCRVYDNSLTGAAALIFHEANGTVILQKNRNEL